MSEGPPAKRRAGCSSYFNPSWEEAYFFVEWKGSALCLVCHKAINQLKQYCVRRHYTALHSAEYAHLSEEERLAEVERLKANLLASQKELSEDDGVADEASLRASYIVAQKVAKAGQPFTLGDFLKDVMVDVAQELCPAQVHKYRNLSLSRMTILRRCEEMASSVTEQLRVICSNFTAFSLALDESTDVTGTAQLAIFIRGVDDELVTTEELLDFLPMKDTTTGEDILLCVEQAVDRANLDWGKLVSVTTDGAPSMIGSNIGFLGRLRRKLRNLAIPREIMAIHCLIHQEHLCAKSIELKNVMAIVVQVTNYIRNHGCKRRQFKTFLDELGVEYGELPYHTEVRWLSRGKVLDRFFHIRQELCLFMDMAGHAVPQLEDDMWIRDLAFLSDITDHLNALNLVLQGRDHTVVQLFDSIQLFKAKLELWIGQLNDQDTTHFKKLESVAGDKNFNIYVTVLESLLQEFVSRFQDLLQLDLQLQIITAPFQFKASSAPANLQIELLELQNTRFLKLKYNEQGENVLDFYRYLPRMKFPHLRKLVADVKSIFGSTYACEQLFSSMKRIKSIHRSRLTDQNLRNCLILSTSEKILPDISALVQNRKQRRSREASTVEQPEGANK